jgi:hypothetical protein
VSTVILFPDAKSRELRRLIADATKALDVYLADGPKPSTSCRRIVDKLGGDRFVYEEARASLELWNVVNYRLALPKHGRALFWIDHDGRRWPIAAPLKTRRTRACSAPSPSPKALASS